jgi:hypothetical protein
MCIKGEGEGVGTKVHFTSYFIWDTSMHRICLQITQHIRELKSEDGEV